MLFCFLRLERAHLWVLEFLGFFIVGASKMRSDTAFERDAPGLLKLIVAGRNNP